MKRTVRIFAFVAIAIITAPLYAQGAGLSKGEATAERKKDPRVIHSELVQRMLADMKRWNVGDYAVVKGDKVKVGLYKHTAYGIKNTKTGNYVIDPFNKKPKEGDKILLRDVKEAYGQSIRLYEPPAGDPTGKPFVWCRPKPNIWKVEGKSGYFSHDSFSPNWFQINDQDQLEMLEEMKLESKPNGGLQKFYEEACCCYVKRGGKVGVYVLGFFGDEYTYNSNGLATGVVSEKYRVDMIIPVKYDAIQRKGSFYQAMKDDGFDLYNGWNLRLAHSGLKKYDELTRFDNHKLIALLNGKYGAVDHEGRVLIPFVYGGFQDVRTALHYFNKISFTEWYKQEAAKYIDKKGEYEKTAHFEARLKDAKLQEEYLREVMGDAPQRYLAEKTKEGVKLNIGQYDADKEAFPISIGEASWNNCLLPVPIAEAEAFKTAFNDMKEEAAKGARLGIRYDAPSIEAITFKMPNGKEYHYGEK